MKNFIALVFFFSLSFAAHGNQWVKTNSINSVEIWKHTGTTNVRIVKDVIRTERKFPLSHFHSPVFKEDLQENKKNVLKHLGITDWLVEVNEIRELNNEVIVDMSGSYSGPSKVKTYFLERQVYGPSSMTSFLYTSPSLPDATFVHKQFDEMRK